MSPQLNQKKQSRISTSTHISLVLLVYLKSPAVQDPGPWFPAMMGSVPNCEPKHSPLSCFCWVLSCFFSGPHIRKARHVINSAYSFLTCPYFYSLIIPVTSYLWTLSGQFYSWICHHFFVFIPMIILPSILSLLSLYRIWIFLLLTFLLDQLLILFLIPGFFFWWGERSNASEECITKCWAKHNINFY